MKSVLNNFPVVLRNLAIQAAGGIRRVSHQCLDFFFAHPSGIAQLCWVDANGLILGFELYKDVEIVLSEAVAVGVL